MSGMEMGEEKAPPGIGTFKRGFSSRGTPNERHHLPKSGARKLPCFDQGTVFSGLADQARVIGREALRIARDFWPPRTKEYRPLATANV
jgi:hypothetical protein